MTRHLPLYVCDTCGERIRGWAPAERHAAGHGGGILWWVGEEAA